MYSTIADSSQKKSITWITPDYFVDCDFNITLFSGILKYFHVYWIILLPKKNARFSEQQFSGLKKVPGIEIEFFYWTCRARSPKMLTFYRNIYNRVKVLNSDLVYFNETPTNPYSLLLYWKLVKEKTILTAHDGNIKPSFKMAWISSIVFKLAYQKFLFVNTFSATQEAVFKSTFTKVESFNIPLSLKNFGHTGSTKRNDNIIFFFFGSVHSNKNVGLLIHAACNLYDKGFRGFKISINGSCDNWSLYSTLIKYPELFECDIRLINNSEIPALFEKNHYMVFPYKEMSQSGAIKVAFNYGVPVIVSNLKGFTDEVVDGQNGFIFKSEDVNDLEKVMIERLRNHAVEYEKLQAQVHQYNKEYYAPEVLAEKYVHMFNTVISRVN